MVRLLPIICFVLLFNRVHGQGALNIKLENIQRKPLSEFLKEVESSNNIKSFYIEEWLTPYEISDDLNGLTLREGLNIIFRESDISYRLLYDYALIFVKDPKRGIERDSILREANAEQKKIERLTIGEPSKNQVSKKIVISGIVTDGKSKEPITGASVYVVSEKIATTTDMHGHYSLNLTSGAHILFFQYLNYDEKVLDLNANNDGVVSVELTEAPRLLQEVIINAQHLNAVNSRVGQVNLNLANIKKTPSFLGEIDVIKQIQTLPGVTSVGEVSSGYNVRGGGVDQNLMLYDGIQTFNNSHVFGFFSAFNSETIKEASFFKGGIPAEYGGRVSSVLSLTSKEGNYKKWQGAGGIGLVSSSISADGPIKKDISSLSVSVRSSYSDWLLKRFTTQYQNIKNSSVAFYDASMKFTQKLGSKDKLSFSGYSSRDHFGLPSDTTFIWNNLLGSLHYDHVFSERASTNITLGFGKYSYRVSDSDPITAYQMIYKIQYPSLNADYVYQKERHRLNVGINGTYYSIQPGEINPDSEQSTTKSITLNSQKSLESALYISEGYDITETLHIDAGFRLSMFTSFGPATIYSYRSGEPLSQSTRTDSIIYTHGSIIKSYIGPEPRLSLRYSLRANSSIKLGYNRIFQYLHLISNSVAVTPIDIWQPSNSYFKPQRGDQISLGYYQNFKDEMFEFSLEGFYKKIANVLDFKDAAQLVLNPNLETALLKGTGKSYGIEAALNKTKGKFSGTLNYTYSRSLRKIAGSTDEESINKGNYYPSNYDQPNVINLNWKHDITRRISFTGNFTYRTGRPITVPYSYAIIENIPVVNFSARNQYRVPDYHRLDLGLVIEGGHKRKKIFDGIWTISVYNAYARKNVYTVFYAQNSNGLQSAYKMAIVGTVLPSVSYRFKLYP